MNLNKFLKSKKAGSALVLAMLVMVILLIMGGALLSLGLNSRIFAIRNASMISARCAADAGLTKAIFEMNKKLKIKPWSGSTLPQATGESLPGCGAGFSYLITGDVSTGYIVHSTGVFNHAEREVHSTLEIQLPMFEHPFFAAEGFEIKNATILDGYNSDNGLYDVSNQCPTSLGTNSTEDGAIRLDNNALITGDVFVGPDGTPEDVINAANNAVITGQTSAIEEEKELPLISPPLLSYKGSKPTGIISSSGQYDEIELTNQEKLTIHGDVVLVINNGVEIDNLGVIEITEGSSLMLYIGEDFKVSNGGYINNLTKSPPQCKIYGTSLSEVNYLWDNVSAFYGAVYAPNGNIEIKNNARIFGALIGGYVKVDNSAELHGDETLKKGSVDDYGAEFVINRWWE